eukprot:319784_1
MEQLKIALEHLQKTDTEKRAQTSLLIKIVHNIIKHPDDKKYRNLNFKKIRKKLQDEQAMIILESIGFKRYNNDTRLRMEKVNLNQLQIIYRLLNSLSNDTQAIECNKSISHKINNEQQNKLKQLVSMGFNEQISSFALSSHNYDINRAIEYILHFQQNLCECRGNISKCYPLKQLANVMIAYRCSKLNIEEININIILNHFLHLIDAYKNDEFELIYDTLGGFCDIEQCNIFKRNHRDRCQYNNVERKVNDKIALHVAILDKIHCFYSHSFDIGHRVTVNEKNSLKGDMKMQNHILSNKHKLYRRICGVQRRNKFNKFMTVMQHDETDIKRDAILYDYGYLFEYTQHKCTCNICICEVKNHISTPVNQKFKSLKHELIANSIASLTVEQYNLEYQKARTHFHSYYCKNLRQKYGFKMDHILGIMIYCNYDFLQHEFSKTFRQIHGNEITSDILKRHSSFWWLGYRLKQCVHLFGDDSILKNVFYHGIDKQVYFPFITHHDSDNAYDTLINICVPLSTSISLEVAANFAANGLIVEFGRNDGKYFACNWLSDYPNELEHLFVQGTRFQFNNILEIATGMEYRLILRAIDIIRYAMSHDYEDKSINPMLLRFISTGKTQRDIDSNMISLINIIIEHQLSLKMSTFKTVKSLNGYANHLINNFCMQQQHFSMNWNHSLNSDVYQLIRRTDFDWIRFNLLTTLFPNLVKIVIQNTSLCSEILDDILKHLSINKHYTRRLNLIEIDPNREIDLDSFVDIIIPRYKREFDKIDFDIYAPLWSDIKGAGVLYIERKGTNSRIDRKCTITVEN